MAKSIVATFTFEGEEPKTVSTEVEGKLSDALLDFRAACMEHLTSYISAQSKGEAAEVNDDAFADNSDVEEDNVDAFLKGKNNKRQKT